MSRIWLLRGCAAAVLAVLIGAWALGVAGGDSGSPSKEEAGDPVPADTSTSEEPSDVVETTKPRRARESATTTDPTDEATPDAVDDASGEVAGVAETRTPSAKPTPRPSAQTPKPTKKPTPTPSQPADGCTDLVGVIDCLLAPITTQP